jgi:hypothetical protein
MKIRSVKHNNHRKVFIVRIYRGSLSFPYAKAEPPPTASDAIREVYIDKEIGREGFTYVLESGREGTIHVDQVLEYNRDPAYMRNLLLYQLTVAALERIEESPLSKREIIRRLGTSPAQLYRLLDTTNYRKSIDKLLLLLYVLDCDVDCVVRAKSA